MINDTVTISAEISEMEIKRKQVTGLPLHIVPIVSGSWAIAGARLKIFV